MRKNDSRPKSSEWSRSRYSIGSIFHYFFLLFVCFLGLRPLLIYDCRAAFLNLLFILPDLFLEIFVLVAIQCDGFFQVLRPVWKTILRGIVFFVLRWYLDSIRLLKRFKSDLDRVKTRWNFTEIQGVGDLKNTGNEEKCKKIEKKETVCFMPKQLWQMEKRRVRNHFPDDSVREFFKNYKNEAVST